MKSGRTLWDELVRHYTRGAEDARTLEARWSSLHGEMLAAMRTVAPVQDVWITRSKDGGKTWDEPRQVTQKLVHPADLVQLPDGRVLLVAGDRRAPFGVIGLVGSAEKLEWTSEFPLHDAATNLDCGYPSSVVLKDGRVLTLYYAVGDKEHADWGVHCGAYLSAAGGIEVRLRQRVESSMMTSDDVPDLKLRRPSAAAPRDPRWRRPQRRARRSGTPSGCWSQFRRGSRWRRSSGRRSSAACV